MCIRDSYTTVTSDGFNFENGNWRLSYQKRVVDSAQWVNESVNNSIVIVSDESDESWLGGPPIIDLNLCILVFIGAALVRKR